MGRVLGRSRGIVLRGEKTGDARGEVPEGRRRRSLSPPAASWRREVGETVVGYTAGVDRVVRVVSPSFGARAGTTPMRLNKSLQPALHRGGACSGEAAGLERRSHRAGGAG